MNKEILLSNGMVAIVDDEDYERLSQFNWFVNKGYAARSIKINSKWTQMKMHRDIINAPDGIMVDHINRNTLDNRKKNLRLCNNSLNQMNRKITEKTSEYKGVSWNKKLKKWKVGIKFDGKMEFLGYFSNEISGANCYNHYAKLYFKEFANLNSCPIMDNWAEFKSSNKNKYKGVSYNKKLDKYCAFYYESRTKKNKHIGVYATAEEARDAVEKRNTECQ